MTPTIDRRMRTLTPVALALSVGLLWSDASWAQTADGCRDNWLAFGPCRDRPWEGPRFTFGVDLGVSAMNESGPLGFGVGVGTVTEAGPAWGLRVGVDLLSWVGLEARYVGMYNSVQSAVSPAGSVGFATSGVDALARLTAPLPFVNPYVVGGIGYYDVSLAGSSQARSASVMHPSSQPALVVGIGLEVPLTWRLAAGVEADYHHQSNESYSAVTTNGIDGGDLTTFNVVVRARL